jgi:hypothetical protein
MQRSEQDAFVTVVTKIKTMGQNARITRGKVYRDSRRDADLYCNFYHRKND